MQGHGQTSDGLGDSNMKKKGVSWSDLFMILIISVSSGYGYFVLYNEIIPFTIRLLCSLGLSCAVGMWLIIQTMRADGALR